MVEGSTAVWAVDAAIVVLTLEAFALFAVWGLRKRGLPFLTSLLITAAGLGLLFALRTALHGGSVLWILVGLTLGGMAHAADLYRRLRT